MTKRLEIKPLVRCALDGSVVQIEPVDVDVRRRVGVSLPVSPLVDWFAFRGLEN